MTASVVPAMIGVLEPYLDAKARAWSSRPEAGPTLPHRLENGILSIHVGRLVSDLGFNPEWRQHFKKQELRTLVNAICREQGLRGIGESGPLADAEPAVRAVIVRQGSDNHRLSQQLAEAQAAILWQRRRIAELEEQIGLAQGEGVFIRSQPVRDL